MNLSGRLFLHMENVVICNHSFKKKTESRVCKLSGRKFYHQAGLGVRNCTELQSVDFALSLNAKFIFQTLPDSKHAIEMRQLKTLV